MPEESTTPDPVQLVRQQVEALTRGDLDGVLSNVTEDGVLDGRFEVVQGRARIREFLEAWFSTYEEVAFELEEFSHLGGGVVFAVVTQDGRLIDGGHLRQSEGWVYVCESGAITRLTTRDVDEGRALAEAQAPDAIGPS